jgi:hypothetical protein
MEATVVQPIMPIMMLLISFCSLCIITVGVVSAIGSKRSEKFTQVYAEITRVREQAATEREKYLPIVRCDDRYKSILAGISEIKEGQITMADDIKAIRANGSHKEG